MLEAHRPEIRINNINLEKSYSKNKAKLNAKSRFYRRVIFSFNNSNYDNERIALKHYEKTMSNTEFNC